MATDGAPKRKILHNARVGPLRAFGSLRGRFSGQCPDGRGERVGACRRYDEARVANDELRVAHVGRDRRQTAGHPDNSVQALTASRKPSP